MILQRTCGCFFIPSSNGNNRSILLERSVYRNYSTPCVSNVLPPAANVAWRTKLTVARPAARSPQHRPPVPAPPAIGSFSATPCLRQHGMSAVFYPAAAGSCTTQFVRSQAVNNTPASNGYTWLPAIRRKNHECTERWEQSLPACLPISGFLATSAGRVPSLLLSLPESSLVNKRTCR